MSEFRNFFQVSTAPTRTKNIFVAGQSLAVGYVDRNAWAGLVNTLYSNSWTTGLVGQVNAAVGGTSADESGIDPASGNHWWTVSTNSAGPLLTSALAAASGKTFDFCIFDLGQADAFKISIGTQTKARYKSSIISILTALKAAISCPIYIQMIGRRGLDEDGFSNGCQYVREALLEIIASTSLISGFVDVYDLERIDDVHPTNASYEVIGSRMASLVTGNYTAPTVSSSAVSSGGYNIGLTGTIDTPINTSVIGFAGRKSGTYVPLKAVVTSNHALRLTAASGQTDFDAICYPYDNLQNFDTSNGAMYDGNFPLKTCVFAV